MNISLQHHARIEIWIKLTDAAGKYPALDTVMKNANFNPAGNDDAGETAFTYYGNCSLLQVAGKVKEIAGSMADQFSYTVMKNKLVEQQSHAAAVATCTAEQP